MIKIRALRPSELKQVLSLLNRYSEQESEYSLLQKIQQLYIPLHRVSQVLPLALQFMPAIFVAVSNEKILGVIWISRDGKHSRRWKIEHLILDPDSFSYDVGTQLVHYVINRYGGDGVQTFLAYVDQYYQTGLDLLKSCGFRRCTRLHYFCHRNPGNIVLQPIKVEGLRESTNDDCGKLSALYNEHLTVEARVCLEKSWRDFYHPFPDRLRDKMNGVFFKRWVVQDLLRDCLVASVEIRTQDYREFFIHLVANAAWEHAYFNLLTYAIQQILLITSNAVIYIDCYEFVKKGIDALEGYGFQRSAIAEVLVKDYWIPIEDKGSRLQSPILVFSGKTSPAINCKNRSVEVPPPTI